jgi:hypothetical protein
MLVSALPTSTIETVPVKAKPWVDQDELFSIRPDLLNEAYVYVHCHVPPVVHELFIRIWKTTFLIDQATGTRSALIHAENITFAPVWTFVPANQGYSFLLIFEGLAKSCRIFNLVEDIPQPGGFDVRGIHRNTRDVYHVQVV